MLEIADGVLDAGAADVAARAGLCQGSRRGREKPDGPAVGAAERRSDGTLSRRLSRPDRAGRRPTPEFSGRYEIDVDGRINLGDYGRLAVEGRTPAEIVKLLAAETGTSPETLAVRVVEFRSQHLLLFGEVSGWQHSIAYRGQETVLDLLQRVGGITAGAEPKDIFVVRPHLGESKRPEVFHVDLHAIVIKHDLKTNLRLMPYDQIYVGETRRAQIEKAVPPWLRWTLGGDGAERKDAASRQPKD